MLPAQSRGGGCGTITKQGATRGTRVGGTEGRVGPAAPVAVAKHGFVQRGLSSRWPKQRKKPGLSLHTAGRYHLLCVGQRTEWITPGDARASGTVPCPSEVAGPAHIQVWKLPPGTRPVGREGGAGGTCTGGTCARWRGTARRARGTLRLTSNGLQAAPRIHLYVIVCVQRTERPLLEVLQQARLVAAAAGKIWGRVVALHKGKIRWCASCGASLQRLPHR